LKIFDSVRVAELVKSWLDTRDNDTLDSILEETRPLAEYIARRYTPDSPEDLTQSALMKVMASLEHYNHDISNIHTYFSTVIRNSCTTQYVKDKILGACEITTLEDIENSSLLQTFDVSDIEEDCYVADLILRNINRFPSLKPAVVGNVTKLIYVHTRDGIHNKSRGIVSELVRKLKINRIQAKTLYRSTIAYMRMKHITNSQITKNEAPEMSILPEVKEFLGNKKFEEFVCVFSGITINIK